MIGPKAKVNRIHTQREHRHRLVVSTDVPVMRAVIEAATALFQTRDVVVAQRVDEPRHRIRVHCNLTSALRHLRARRAHARARTRIEGIDRRHVAKCREWDSGRRNFLKIVTADDTTPLVRVARRAETNDGRRTTRIVNDSTRAGGRTAKNSTSARGTRFSWDCSGRSRGRDIETSVDARRGSVRTTVVR